MQRIAHINNGYIANISIATDDYILPSDNSQMLESDALEAGFSWEPRPENSSGENLYEVLPEGFFLRTDDASRNAFSQMTTLIQEAMSLGFIDNNTPQTIADSQNRKQTLTTLRFRQIMVGYGMFYKNLWDSLNS